MPARLCIGIINLTFQRVGRCRKYNLGAGYRLVTLKQGSDLYLLFAGTHDECARWIENNREHLPLEMITERSRTVQRPVGRKPATAETSPSPDIEPEEDWISSLDDQELRVIFSGLIGGN